MKDQYYEIPFYLIYQWMIPIHKGIYLKHFLVESI